jgi:hypothetical protein
VDYRNVKVSPADMEEMLIVSKGRREVPVILHKGTVSIGWEGGT